MKAQIKVIENSKVEMKYMLDKFIKLTGQTIEDGIDKAGEAMGKRLISTVQPYGTSKKTGDAFALSIAKQVNRAIKHANVTGQDGSASSVHSKNRDSQGQVPRDIRTTGKFKRDPVSRSELDILVKKKMANAGVAKGAWFAAMNQVSSNKMTGVGKWITKHENKGLGSCEKIGKGINRSIILINKTPYIESVQSNEDVEKSIKDGLNNFYKWVNITMRKTLEKLNQ
jgi:hypothetical protein